MPRRALLAAMIVASLAAARPALADCDGARSFVRGAGDRAVALTEAARAGVLWTEIERAGREAGIGHVGADAVSHLSPLAR